jgi:predicted nucleic acid-binding protein
MPSDPVFIDASGWIALLNTDDWLHAPAVALFQEFEKSNRLLVTTEWILAEAGNGLARPKTRSPFVSTVKSLFESSVCRIVPVNRSLFMESLDLYGRALDKSWGLIDCSSFVVMHHEKIAECMTADRHFSQAGFQCLLPTRRE